MPETTLLFSEILDLVHKAKTKDKKVEILRKYNSDAFRMIIKSSFDPEIRWTMPEGNVPYEPNDAPQLVRNILDSQPKQRNYIVSFVGVMMVHHSSKKNKCLFRC